MCVQAVVNGTYAALLKFRWSFQVSEGSSTIQRLQRELESCSRLPTDQKVLELMLGSLSHVPRRQILDHPHFVPLPWVITGGLPMREQENHSPMRDSSNFGGAGCGSRASMRGSPAKLMSPPHMLGGEPLSPAVMRTLSIAGRQGKLSDSSA